MYKILIISALIGIISANPKLGPIIIIPGLGGSALEAKLQNAPQYRDCQTNSDWYTIWFSAVQIMTRYDCFVKNFQVHLKDGLLQDTEGVQIRPKGYGGVESIEYANSGTTSEPPYPYFYEMIRQFEMIGYRRNISLRAAPFDFRKSGKKENIKQDFQRLQSLIEQTVFLNNGKPAHIITHSLGGPYTNLFLTSFVDKQWKNKYIQSLIILNAPLLGTPMAKVGLMIGPMFDWIPQQIPQIMAPIIRSVTPMIWLMPRKDHKGFNTWTNQLITTPTKKYTLDSNKQFLKDINATILHDIYDEVVQNTINATRDPDVAVFCAYVNDTQTLHSMEMPDDSFDKKGYVFQSTWGDGTVNIESLEYCKTWKDVQQKSYPLGGSLSAHQQIVTHKLLIEDIIGWIVQKTDFQKI